MPQQPTRGRKRQEALTAYLFIAPWVLGFVVFTGGPIIASLVLSFYKWKMIAPPQFIGWDNYVKMFTNDELFRTSLRVTFTYVLLYIPLSQLLALVLALLLNQKVRWLGLWRTFFYLPAVVSGVAGSVLWAWMYQPELGIVNHLLGLVGLEGQNWLFNKQTVLGALVVKSLWNVGVPMVIYLAALQAMPQMLYEATEIDGAGEWAKFRHITLPMLSPAIFFNAVIGIINGIQTFAEPYVMTQGGPDNATLFLGLHLYQNAFHFLNMGYASAMAWIMFLLVLALTVLQFQLSSRWVYYEGEAR
ncbi:MAG: sugar ABC transporter permease [Caldilinea sp. CFX5]|nr:sugar ABC transporter permease [Caldilinea sp. CFX5]